MRFSQADKRLRKLERYTLRGLKMRHKLFSAMLASSIMPLWVLIMVVYAYITEIPAANVGIKRLLRATITCGSYASLVAFLMIVIFVIPIFSVLRNKNVLNTWTALISGAILGVFPLLPFAIETAQILGPIGYLVILYGTLMGGTGAVLFLVACL